MNLYEKRIFDRLHFIINKENLGEVQTQSFKKRLQMDSINPDREYYRAQMQQFRQWTFKQFEDDQNFFIDNLLQMSITDKCPSCTVQFPKDSIFD